MLRNSAADTFYGGFTASKIRRLIRRAVIFRRIFGGQYSAANSAIGHVVLGLPAQRFQSFGGPCVSECSARA